MSKTKQYLIKTTKLIGCAENAVIFITANQHRLNVLTVIIRKPTFNFYANDINYVNSEPLLSQRGFFKHYHQLQIETILLFYLANNYISNIILLGYGRKKQYTCRGKNNSIG